MNRGHLSKLSGLLALALASVYFVSITTYKAYSFPETIAIDSTTITIEPVADSLTNKSAPDTNYGERGWLYVSSSIVSYVMFELPALPANSTIAGASLKLRASRGSTGSLDVHHCPDDSWIEGGITWNNKPSYTAERTYRLSTGYWLGWDAWDVTPDVERNYRESDKKITLVVVSAGAYANYSSRESKNKPQLTINYLAAPCYRISVESVDETRKTSNVGSILLSDQDCSLPNEVLAKPGIYPLEYAGDYEFVRWDTEGSVSVASPLAEKTTADIQGAGRIKAVGRSAGLALESVQDTGATSNIGYIAIQNEHYVLPKSISLIKPGTYQISYEGGYKFLKWETIGNVSIADESKPTTTITIFAGNSTIRAIGSGEVMEYAYDDGEAQYYEYKNEDTGSMWAVGFTPLFSGKLLTARLFILKDPSTFKLHIMDANRNNIIDPIIQAPSKDGWFDVDLSGFNIRVKARDDFLIGIEWIVKGKPSIGYDGDSPVDRMSWHWNGTAWDEYPYYNDIMVRTVVETSMLKSQITSSLDHASVARLGNVTISGSVSPADSDTAGAPVLLQYSSDGIAWSNITNISCVSSGYSYSWSPGLPVGRYLIRASWQGSETYFGSKSEPQELTITKAQTALTCSFDVTTTETDKTVKVFGRLQPAIKYATMVLVITTPEGYQYNRTTLLTTGGSFEVSITASTEGTWKVKAYWSGDENNLGCESTVSELQAVSPLPYFIIGVLGFGTFVIIIGGLIVFFVLRGRKRKPNVFPPPPPP